MTEVDRMGPEHLIALDGLIGGGLVAADRGLSADSEPGPGREPGAGREPGPDAAPDVLPPLWHWTYFLPRPAQNELGPDGHPSRRSPAPPAPGLRRMFAGGRVSSYESLRIGRTATVTSTVSDPVVKESRAGTLWFVTQRLDYHQDDHLCVSEEKDIVYRGQHAGGGPLIGQRRADALAPLPVEAGELEAGRMAAGAIDAGGIEAGGIAAGGIDLAVDETLLFRFSALTYNAHRIHYDLAWAEHEGYAGLVVHGPLQGILMGELLRRSGRSLLGHRFAYRLVAPCVGTQTLRVRELPVEDGTTAGASGRSTGAAGSSPGVVARVGVFDAAATLTASATLTTL